MNKIIRLSEKIILGVFLLGLMLCFFAIVEKTQQECEVHQTKAATTVVVAAVMGNLAVLQHREEINKIVQNSLEISSQISAVINETILAISEELENQEMRQELISMGSPEYIADIIIIVSNETGVPAKLILSQIGVENAPFDCYAISGTGDYGLCQINLQAHPWITPEMAFDPEFSIEFQATLLKNYQQEFGSWWAALVCYNAGPNAYWSYQEPISSQYYADRILSASGL